MDKIKKNFGFGCMRPFENTDDNEPIARRI